jgi:hypothetical protein
VDAEQPEAIKRVYVPVEDTKLERLLEMSAARGLTIEELIQGAAIRQIAKAIDIQNEQ